MALDGERARAPAQDPGPPRGDAVPRAWRHVAKMWQRPRSASHVLCMRAEHDLDIDDEVEEAADPEYSWERLDAAEASLKVEEADARAYERRCMARAQAEEDWVDAVVAEQEENAARRAALAREKPAGATQRPSSADNPWAEALAPFGLGLAGGVVGDPAGGGRGLIALRPFARGDVLMRTPPSAAVLSRERSSGRCHHCFRAVPKLLRCSACSHARYCCASHQRAAWADHRGECAMLRACKPRVPGVSMLLLARTLRLLDPSRGGAGPNGAGGDGTRWAVGGAAVRSLCSQLERFPEERRAQMCEQAAMLCSLLEHAFNSSPPIGLAADLLGTIAINGHTVCDDELAEIGIGLYPLAALTNHDCDPSAAQTFGDNAELTLRALRDLAPGDAVTIGYIDLAATTSARRKALRDSYLFECRCARCVAGDAAASSAARAVGAASVCDAAAELRESDSAALAAIDQCDWEAALRHSRRCTQLGSALYPQCTPAFGLKLYREGKLLAHLERLDEAARVLRKALGVLGVSHGSDSSLVSALREHLFSVEAEAAQQGAAARHQARLLESECDGE